MANQDLDLAGLLTGISNRPQPVQGQPIPGSPNFRGMFGAQMASDLQAGVGKLARGGAPSQAQKMQQFMSQLDLNSVEDLTKLAKIMQASGDMAGAAKVAAKIQAMKQSGKQREQLIAQATKLRLPETADMLIGGGDVETATKQILDAEERNIISKQGRQGKLAVARSKNAGQPVYDAIKKGDYDNLSDTLFLEQLKGEKATLKTFQQTIDGKSISKPFRVNEAGRVWDLTSEKWVNPSEIGLTQAPLVSKVLSQGNSIITKLTEGSVDNFLELNEKARSAEKVLILNSRSKELMEQGIVSGFGATWGLDVMRLGKQLGMLPESMNDTVAATETFIATRARQVLAVLGSGAVGSGTGISDKDIEFLKETEAARIELDAGTLSRLLRIEEQASRFAINQNNEALDRLQQAAGSGLDSNTAEGYYVSIPDGGSYSTPAAALKYLPKT